jgi:carbonic anhydrase
MISGEVGDVSVITTSNSTLGPEHWANRATEQVISIGEDAHPLIVDQAKAFKDRIRHVFNYYIKEAIKEDRSKVITLLRSAGHNDLANSVEKL